MKQLYSAIIFTTFLSVNFLCAQNVAVNTSGTSAASTNMFEVTQSSGTNNTVGIFSRHNGAATNAYAIWAEATGGTNNYAIVIPAGGGSVGIGTTTPATMFEIAGTTSSLPTIRETFYGSGNNARIQLRSASGTIASPGAVINGNRLSAFNSFGHDGTNFILSSQIISDVDGTVSTGIIPTRITFETMNTSGTLAERVRIDNAGNVGIGTTVPAASLEIKGAGTTLLRTQPNLASQDNVLIFGAASATLNRAKIYSTGNTGDVDGDLRFAVGLANVAVDPAIVIRSTGNVGIGTSGPAYKLDISLGDGDGVRMSSTLHATFDANAYENVMRPLSTNSTQGSNKPNNSYFFQGLSAGCNYGSFQILGSSSNDIPLIYWRTEQQNTGVWNPWLQFVSYNSSGNVGIGTSSPAASLDVVGTVKMFGTRTGLAVNTVYGPATSDGFLCVFGREDCAGGTATMDVYADGSNPPTTLLGTGYSNNNGVTYLGAFQLTIPIKKGEYYQAVFTPPAGGCLGVGNLYFIPLGH